MLNARFALLISQLAFVFAGGAYAQAPAPGPADRNGGGAAEFSALTPCDEARFSVAETQFERMQVGDRKSRARSELDAALEMFKRNESRACSIHLSSAMLWMR
jgi:hypothetical protein